MDDNPLVAPLDRSMLDAANDTLVTAFVDDSLVEWVFPDPSTRVRRLHRLKPESVVLVGVGAGGVGREMPF